VTLSLIKTQPTERAIAAGDVEKLFPQGPESACLARLGFAKSNNSPRPGDDGYYLARGLLAGSMMNIVSEQFTTDGTMRVDLGGLVDRLLGERTYRRFPPSVLTQIRSEAIEMVRGWQSRVGPDNDLDISMAVSLLKPEHDLFVRREGKFRIRVRPDHVVAAGDTIVAQEWSTSKNPNSISEARFALNAYALLRERHHRPDWQQYTGIVSRVEMIGLGYGFTVRLNVDELEQWRLAIGNAVEQLIAGETSPNQGPWCSTCPWQSPCWFGDISANDPAF
jgi:hypothetical protein